MKRRCRGFTLIELLVVVAIIGVLIAILLPSLGRARMQAKRSQCQAALKGWGQGIFTYMADNQGQFAEQNAAGTWASSPGVYDNYFNVGKSSGQVISRFRDCPAEPALPGANPAPGGGFVNALGKTVKVNYLHVRFNPKVGSRIYNVAKIGNPSNKLLMCDGYWNNGTAVSNIQSPTHVVTADDGLVMTQDDTTGNLIPKYDMGEILKDRHGGNGQIIFCDGHAESLPWADWVANIPQLPFTTVPAAGDEGKTWTVIQYQ